MMNHDFVGKTLGTCTLEKHIGQGGMGVVYLARQTRPARTVAVKILFPNITLSSDIYQEFLARFRREADLIAELEHINIMPIYEYGEQDGLAYLVMPHLPGGSLREVLARNGPLTLSEASTFITQAAAALDYAHMHGVIHRDIKPSNFLLHSDGRLVLTDFGIARLTTVTQSSGPTLTSTGSLLGTPEYMAPEMVHGLPIDHRADIYELGIVLFQMLSGYVPFKGDTPLVIAIKHTHESLPSLHRLNPTLPAAVDTILQKATAKNPADRYPSAGAFAQALQQIIPTSTTFSAINTLNSPTIASPHYAPPLVVPAPVHDTPPPVRHEVTTEAGYTVPAYPAHVQTHGQLSPASPSQKRSPLLLILVSCILIGVAIGTVAALHYRASLAANLLTGTTTPSTITQHLNTPTAVPTRPAIRVTPNTQPTTVPPAAIATSPDQAQATVQQYYNDINAKAYLDAYNLEGGPLRGSASYDQFARGYATTQHDSITFGDITSLSDGTVKVALTIVAIDQTTSGTTTTSTYQGYYIVGQENNSTKLLNGHFDQTATTSTAIQDAQTVVQNYYADVNSSDYHSAYNLWLNYAQSYDQFASGYANTLSTSISITSATQLSDGTVKVVLTLVATDRTSSGGSVTSTYNGYYIVIQTGNGWKLKTGHFQKVS